MLDANDRHHLLTVEIQRRHLTVAARVAWQEWLAAYRNIPSPQKRLPWERQSARVKTAHLKCREKLLSCPLK